MNASTNAVTDVVSAREARRERRKARKVATEAKVYVSMTNRLPDFTPGVWADRTRERLDLSITDFLDKARTDLLHFRRRFDDDAHNAFDWSKDAFKSAGVEHAMLQLQEGLAEMDGRNDGYAGGSNRQTIKWLREWMTKEVHRALGYNDDDRMRLAVAKGFVQVLERMEFYFIMPKFQPANVPVMNYE